MKTYLILLLGLGLGSTLGAQQTTSNQTTTTMKVNAGIVTSKLAESKRFYSQYLGFGVTFENEFYLLMHSPNHQAEISFLLPNHPSQSPLFHRPFQGQGLYLTIEVEEVDHLYQTLRERGVPIRLELRTETWGDRHFAVEDPNGIAIDIVTYTAPKTN